MNNIKAFFWLFGVLLLIACSDKRLTKTETPLDDLSALAKLMSGKFSSEEQASQDTRFYNIRLVMIPIWEDDKNSKWLYVEQAAATNLEKPYRQRVYQLMQVQSHTFESKVYELPNPSKYIYAWEQPELFDSISPDSLIVREGCSVFLQKEGECFKGSTKENDCKSSLRGAAYATSIVSVCESQIESWDQGWSAEDKQVWGAEVGGYIFKKIE